MMVTLTEHALCAWHGSECFIRVISLNFFNQINVMIVTIFKENGLK